MNLFYQPLIGQGIHYLNEEESRHCIKVLRKKTGDQLLITDGEGYFYDTVITQADPSRCQVEITNKRKEQTRDFFIHIAISPTKNTERIEWFVEKTVELGIDRITLLDCEHTERSFIRTDRLKKIAVSAMKQSLRASLPVIDELMSFPAIVTDPTPQKFIAHVDPNNDIALRSIAQPKSSCLVLIGPEGDFSTAELKLAASHHFRKVNLGPSRLRTETAGIVACHILNLINS